jgi:hypothetical protein
MSHWVSRTSPCVPRNALAASPSAARRPPPLDEFIEGAERQEGARGEEKATRLFPRRISYQNFPDMDGRNESLRKVPEAVIVIACMTENVSFPNKKVRLA